MPVLGVAGAGDLAGGGLQRGEQRGGAVPDVVVAALFRMPGRMASTGALRTSPCGRGFSTADSTSAVPRVEIQADYVRT